MEAQAMTKRAPVRTRADLETALTLSVDDVGALLALSRHTVRAGIESGAIPALKVGRAWRVPATFARQVLGVQVVGDVAPVIPRVGAAGAGQ